METDIPAPPAPAPSRTVPPVPAALKWAVSVGSIIPAGLLAIIAFAVVGIGNAWSTSGHSPDEPFMAALAVGVLTLAVLCVPAMLLCKGVRGVRPVYTMVLSSLALAVGEAVSALAIGWLLVCAVPLYSPDVTEFLRTRRPRRGGDADDAAAFAVLKADFDRRTGELKDMARRAGQRLSNVFRFCEDVFDEGQEILILVTELTINEYSARFISRYGCQEYFKHNKELLFYERQKEIIHELDSLELE